MWLHRLLRSVVNCGPLLIEPWAFQVGIRLELIRLPLAFRNERFGRDVPSFPRQIGFDRNPSYGSFCSLGDLLHGCS